MTKFQKKYIKKYIQENFLDIPFQNWTKDKVNTLILFLQLEQFYKYHSVLFIIFNNYIDWVKENNSFDTNIKLNDLIVTRNKIMYILNNNNDLIVHDEINIQNENQYNDDFNFFSISFDHIIFFFIIFFIIFTFFKALFIKPSLPNSIPMSTSIPISPIPKNISSIPSIPTDLFENPLIQKILTHLF